MLQNMLQRARQPTAILIFPARNVSSAEVEKSKPEVSQMAFQSSLTSTIYCFLCCPWSCPRELCSVPTSSPNMRSCPISLNLLILCSSVAQLCPTPCDPMDCSRPGFPVHHQLPELIQTHVHRVGDAIRPSHPLSSPSPPVFNLSQD